MKIKLIILMILMVLTIPVISANSTNFEMVSGFASEMEQDNTYITLCFFETTNETYVVFNLSVDCDNISTDEIKIIFTHDYWSYPTNEIQPGVFTTQKISLEEGKHYIEIIYNLISNKTSELFNFTLETYIDGKLINTYLSNETNNTEIEEPYVIITSIIIPSTIQTSVSQNQTVNPTEYRTVRSITITHEEINEEKFTLFTSQVNLCILILIVLLSSFLIVFVNHQKKG